MKIKTNELVGYALNWAVGAADGAVIKVNPHKFFPYLIIKWPDGATWRKFEDYEPAYDWREGGAIIEREKINIEYPRDDLWCANVWLGRPNAFAHGHGDTPLIAAMRCYVAMKLGNEVDVPDELVFE